MSPKDKNNPPFFSIITPSFNQGKYIARTVHSVLSQDFQDFEYSVFDGGSKDETVPVLKSFADSIQWVSEADRGQAHAVNKGLKIARGEVIGWLNSDDIYFPGTLNAVHDFFKKNLETGILYGQADHIDEKNRVLEPYYTEAWNYKKLQEVCYICQPAVFFRRSIIERFGLLDENLNYCMDYEYWLRIGRKIPFYYLKRKLAGSRLYQETKTMGSATAVHREILQMFKDKFGKIPGRWIFNFAHAAARESGLNRGSPEDNLKFVKRIISVSLRTSLRMRYYIPPNEIKTLLRWYVSAKKQVLQNPGKDKKR